MLLLLLLLLLLVQFARAEGSRVDMESSKVGMVSCPEIDVQDGPRLTVLLARRSSMRPDDFKAQDFPSIKRSILFTCVADTALLEDPYRQVSADGMQVVLPSDDSYLESEPVLECYELPDMLLYSVGPATSQSHGRSKSALSLNTATHFP
jgi:hypothetical protein